MIIEKKYSVILMETSNRSKNCQLKGVIIEGQRMAQQARCCCMAGRGSRNGARMVA